MNFRNAREMTNWEYRQYLLAPKPLSQEDGERAHALWLDLQDFDGRVLAVLERFDREHWPALMAMLDAMSGDFDHMLATWQAHLRGLGILKAH